MQYIELNLNIKFLPLFLIFCLYVMKLLFDHLKVYFHFSFYH